MLNLMARRYPAAVQVRQLVSGYRSFRSFRGRYRPKRCYSRLGLARTVSSLNIGREQEELDNLLGAVVEVTALAPPTQAVPHVELLCYRGSFDRRQLLTNRNDVAATQLVFEVEPDALDAIVALNRDTTISSSTTAESGGLRVLLRDPDGHLLCLEGAPKQPSTNKLNAP